MITLFKSTAVLHFAMLREDYSGIENIKIFYIL